MSVPVEVNSRIRGWTTVKSDELHAMIHGGLISIEDAYEALKKTGVELSHRQYPWLREVPGRMVSGDSGTPNEEDTDGETNGDGTSVATDVPLVLGAEADLQVPEDRDGELPQQVHDVRTPDA